MTTYLLVVIVMVFIAQIRLDMYILRKKEDASLEKTSIILSMLGVFACYALVNPESHEGTSVLLKISVTVGWVLLVYFVFIRTWGFQYLKSRKKS